MVGERNITTVSFEEIIEVKNYCIKNNEHSMSLDKIKLKLCGPCREIVENGDDRDLPYSLCKTCFLKHIDGEFGVEFLY